MDTNDNKSTARIVIPTDEQQRDVYDLASYDIASLLPHPTPLHLPTISSISPISNAYSASISFVPISNTHGEAAGQPPPLLTLHSKHIQPKPSVSRLDLDNF